jgi:hypothetical protein
MFEVCLVVLSLLVGRQYPMAEWFAQLPIVIAPQDPTRFSP